MSTVSVVPVNEEILFEKEEMIVSKTDLKGKITYANDIFCQVSEMSTREVIGQPHNIIRHPDMPRTIFKLLWDTVMAGSELFAYVKNMSKTGKYYWVLAHVTPSFDHSGAVNGFHSNRRFPSHNKVNEIAKIYERLKDEEERHTSPKQALAAGSALLNKILVDKGCTYSEFIWTMGE